MQLSFTVTIKAASSFLRIDKSKHIEIIFHFIRGCVQKGTMKLSHVSTRELVVDILTKALMKYKFVFFKDKLGVVYNTFLTKREC